MTRRGRRHAVVHLARALLAGAIAGAAVTGLAFLVAGLLEGLVAGDWARRWMAGAAVFGALGAVVGSVVGLIAGAGTLPLRETGTPRRRSNAVWAVTWCTAIPAGWLVGALWADAMRYDGALVYLAAAGYVVVATRCAASRALEFVLGAAPVGRSVGGEDEGVGVDQAVDEAGQGDLA